MKGLSGALDRVLRHRNKFPRLINLAIDYVADHPTGVLGRLAARRLGSIGAHEVPDVSVVAEQPIRVLIAPVNYSGQGRLWASSLESANSTIAASNMAIDVPGGYSFPADLVVPVAAYHNSAEWQQAQFKAVRQFTHVLVEAGEPLFGRLFGRDVGREVSALLDDGIDIAFMGHGTELRLPSRHAARTSWSPYRDPNLYLARLERLARANLDLLARFDRAVFVSTPDLMWDVPSAIWCPVVVDPARWASPEPSEESSGPLRVLHAPSSSLIKGTNLIEPMLHRLHDAGIIDYRAIERVPSDLMPQLYRSADVVLDQFRLGSYGVAACEGMAAGRMVVGHVLDDVRQVVARSTGRVLPIVQATPDTLERVLVDVASDRAILRQAYRAGMDFVAEVHDGRKSAAILTDTWLATPTV